MPPLSAERARELETLYRTAHDGRVRVRALCVLLAADGRSVPETARVVRYHQETVRRWLRRYLAGGVQSLQDAPKPGAPRKVTPAYLDELQRAASRSPADFGLPFARWTGARLADHLAGQTGLRLSAASLQRLRRGAPRSRPSRTVRST